MSVKEEKEFKEELRTYLADVIETSNREIKGLEVFSSDWLWIASKRTIAEDMLVKFC